MVPQIVEFVAVPRIGEVVHLYDTPSTCHRYVVDEVFNVTYVQEYERLDSDYPPLIMLMLKDGGSTEEDQVKVMLSMCNNPQFGST